MELDIELSKESINKALKELRKLKRNLNSNIHLAGQELAKEGCSILRDNLNSIPDQDGNALGTVYPVLALENSKIFWSGPQISYLEYGTGLVGKGTYKGDLPNGYEYASGPFIKKHIASGKGAYWHYKTKEDYLIRTEGIPAYAPMYQTAKVLRTLIPKYYKNILTKKGGKE